VFRDSNFGCKRAPSLAINWLFENEESGIILEDDCVPHDSFFQYCTWALRTYRDDKRVWHINGNNFDAPPDLFGRAATSFVPLAQVWGWATWRDRWQNFEVNPFYLAERAMQTRRNWPVSRIARTNKLRHIEKLMRGLDAWDFQWQIAILDAGGMALCPRSNLISNVGDGYDATHTPDDPRAHLPVQEFPAVVDTGSTRQNHRLTVWYEKNMGLRNPATAVKYALGRFRSALGEKTKRLLSRVIFGRCKNPVIVASTGRSGSTLLWDAIAESFVRVRFGNGLPEFLLRRFIFLSKEYEPRLDRVASHGFPIIKTHDLAPTCPPGKCIFIFGNPADAVSSADRIAAEEGEIWFQQHLYNLRSHGDLSELRRKDILNYEAQIKAWSDGRADNILLVCYEDLWDRIEEIAAFVGMPLNLPDRRVRATSRASAEGESEILPHLLELYEYTRRIAAEKSRPGSAAA
jgi:hypothetical protein